ncbi:MAG: phosphatase PAP2 family protein [Acidimicrobiales bacterium]
MTARGATEPATTRSRHLFWLRELAVILAFYLVYTWVRNKFGSAAVGPDVAFNNAELMLDIEAAIGLDVEDEIQSWFLDYGWFLRFWNIFYGTFHFLVTAFALIYLYRTDRAAYPRWRTIGLTTTGIALIGFAIFPLMPPRLIGDCSIYGACLASPFVDTVAEHGGWWTFGSGTMEQISNQYAAMPSLHFAWAYWSFLVLAPRLQNRAALVFIWAYPWLTVFAIIVTGNHYWIDAVGGALVLALGYLIGNAIHDWWEGRRPSVAARAE